MSKSSSHIYKTQMHQESIFIIFLALVSYFVYLTSLWGSFIFDDNHMIVENLFIKNPHYFPLLFKGWITSSPIPKGMCRPLLMLTFALNYYAGGLNPISYHIINILFHFLNACLIYFLLKTLKKDTSRGLLFLITLLFVVHPINTEAVTYISSRSDLMVTFFILGGVLGYIKKKRILTCLLYILALLSKETGLCLPLLIVAYDIIFYINSFNGFKKFVKGKNIIFYAALIIITLLYLIYKSTLFSPSEVKIVRSYYSNILIQSVVTLLYLKLFIFPHSLNILHNIPDITSLFQPLVFFSVIVIIGLMLITLVKMRKKPILSLAIAWLLICLLPKFYARLNFVAMEHHFYLPSIGLYIILLAVLKKLYLSKKKYLLSTGTGVIAILVVLNISRTSDYKNPLRFWKIAAQRNPASAYIHNELGRQYLKSKKLKKAELEFKKALSLSRRIADTYISKKMLSNIYIEKKEYNKAEKLLQELSRLTPPPPGVYENLGRIFIERGKKDEALKLWNKELSLYPERESPYSQIGLYYLREGKLRQAKEFFLKSLQKNPDYYFAYYGLGKIKEKEGDYNWAIKYYKKSLHLNPGYPYTHYTLGIIYIKEKMIDEALKELKRVVELDNTFAAAHNDLAVAYASLNPPDWKLARKHIEIAKSLGYKVPEEFLKLIEKNVK